MNDNDQHRYRALISELLSKRNRRSEAHSRELEQRLRRAREKQTCREHSVWQAREGESAVRRAGGVGLDGALGENGFGQRHRPPLACPRGRRRIINSPLMKGYRNAPEIGRLAQLMGQ